MALGSDIRGVPCLGKNGCDFVSKEAQDPMGNAVDHFIISASKRSDKLDWELKLGVAPFVEHAWLSTLNPCISGCKRIQPHCYPLGH
jgi:hypothetical protein